MPPKTTSNINRWFCDTSTLTTYGIIDYNPSTTVTGFAQKSFGNKLTVKSIKYSGKYTTVTWNDDTKTRVSCGKNEQQSRYSAFCSALAIKVFGTNSQVKKIVETKDEQIEIDKQNKLREEQETAAKIRKARKDRLWVKKRAKELALEQRAQELAQQMLYNR